MSGRNVVVTGGTGALGRAVVAAFLAEKDRVVVPWLVPAEADTARKTWSDELASGTQAPIALTDGFVNAFWAGAAIAFVGVLVSIFLVRGRDVRPHEATVGEPVLELVPDHDHGEPHDHDHPHEHPHPHPSGLSPTDDDTA